MFLPPDVGFVHDALQSVAELEERLKLKPDGGTETVRIRAQTWSRFSESDPTYPDEAVQSVHGGEAEVQTEEIEGDDAEQICLK